MYASTYHTYIGNNIDRQWIYIFLISFLNAFHRNKGWVSHRKNVVKRPKHLLIAKIMTSLSVQVVLDVPEIKNMYIHCLSILLPI